MDMDRSESASPGRHGGGYDDDVEMNDVEKSGKYSGRDSKDRKKSGRGEEREKDRDYRSKDRDKERGKERSSRDGKGKDRDYEKERERERDKDRKERGKEKEREREREREVDKERGKEKSRERERVKEKEREKDRDRHKASDKDRDREKGREKTRERERDKEADQDRDRLKEKDRASKKGYEDDHVSSKDDNAQPKPQEDGDGDGHHVKQGRVSFRDEVEQTAEGTSGAARVSSSELEERILKMKEERLKNKPDVSSDVLAFVRRTHKLEEKRNAAKEKAKQLSKIFEEQDKLVQEESEDEEIGRRKTHDLAGVKILHGLEKVMEGGAVVLTLKDQSILADGDVNEEMDMLENVEIGEQKRRAEAYEAAKKKTGIYDDKFNNDPASEKKILPQYDDPTTEEGVTLDEKGRFTGEAEKKLEELRRRLQGGSTNSRLEDLTSSAKISSDYYTQEEMLRFKKPKKKKSLRKKDKLDLDALEREAVSAGLGVGDLGSRSDGRRQAVREQQERSEAEMRKSAYDSALAKADEASKLLRLEQTLTVKAEEDENQVFADDDEDLYKSLERARKLALKNQDAEAFGPDAIARLATTTASNRITDDQNGESEENKVVFTEMEEIVSGIQLDEDAHKPDIDNIFMDEDEAPRVSDEEKKDEAGGWTEVNGTSKDEVPANEDNEEIVPDETIHEVAVGKGLSGALKLLKDRGTLKESIDWGGRNMDKKKSKLVGIVDDDGGNEKFKDIRIERTDEFGRIMTPKEAFRMISHKFHGKGPGKMKQEKRMKQYQEELKLKQMKNSDTPSLSVERMRETQERLKTPYLVLSGHVKPGQTSDPRSGFATVEKDLPGGLTPMLGDSKVEHFLGIKRKPEPGNSGASKKPKT
ncbi:ESCRT II complex subunit Dot2 [Turnera subulata]|uniref:ESCRT II complex subunit Dot2 n=1 Tax=Turnera subulata TaxID=218843 RepID=A0A9Q0FK32_9ROSI|nr:ESCRT II complex subunit Dot2 [Turnera subulata]